MNKTLTVALSMCAGVAMVGAGVFATSSGITTTSTISDVSSQTRQGVMQQVGRFDGKGGRTQSETIKSAIESNDYTKLSTDEQAKITKDQFAKMVTMNTARTAHQTAIETAVKNNDFTAFQTEQKAFKTIMDANKPADMTDDKTRPEPTETELKSHFDEMVTYYKANGKLPEMGGKGRGGHGHGGNHKGGMMSETIKSAIEANDYTKLSTDEQAKITKDQFAKMVTMNTARTAHQTAIETAVKNNDFTAFQTEQKAFKIIMDANKPADMTDDKTRPEPTETELKSHFDEMVTYYKANGKLPEMGGRGEKGMMRGNKRGDTKTTAGSSAQ